MKIACPDRISGHSLGCGSFTFITKSAVANMAKINYWSRGEIDLVMQDGDTLVKIARKVLGSRGRWPEIHSLNRDRLDDPDKVVPGMVIRVPASGR